MIVFFLIILTIIGTKFETANGACMHRSHITETSTNSAPNPFQNNQIATNSKVPIATTLFIEASQDTTIVTTSVLYNTKVNKSLNSISTTAESTETVTLTTTLNVVEQNKRRSNFRITTSIKKLTTVRETASLLTTTTAQDSYQNNQIATNAKFKIVTTTIGISADTTNGTNIKNQTTPNSINLLIQGN